MVESISLQELFWSIFTIFDVSQAFSVWKEYATITDEDLLRKIQKWEKQLFEDLVNRYSQKMYRYLFYYFNFKESIAEDIVQSMFLKLWDKLHKYDNKQRFEPWMYRFAHNFTIDWIRKNKNDDRVRAFSTMLKNKDDSSWNNFEDLFVLDSVDISSEANQSVVSDIVKEVISKLDEKYRDVVLLYYFEQKSYDEISYILWKSVNGVGTLLSRAKKKLKLIIENDKWLKDILLFDL